MKQKRLKHLVLDFLSRTAPRASRPSEKQALDMVICIICLLADQSDCSLSSPMSSFLKSASVSKVKHYKAIKIIADVRNEMKLITKRPECHLI